MKLNQFGKFLTRDEQKILLFLAVMGLLGLIIHISDLQGEAKTNSADSIQVILNKDAELLYDINIVSALELQTIPGIGEKKAHAIVEYRDANKPIRVEDLIYVKGIGENSLENIKRYFSGSSGDSTILVDSPERKETNLAQKNINEASMSDLMRVRGIGKVKAESITKHIETNGRIKKIDQITVVKGIGQKTLENIKEHFYADED